MAIKYKKKEQRQNNFVATSITVLLVCIVFLCMVNHLFSITREDEYENLHLQTKQIKDDITLQLLSDRENLVTMANFAGKLHSDGENYDLMFNSFKPIGLIENIGILNPDNVFVTKAGHIDLDGLISFEEEKQKGQYISGRMRDLTRHDLEIIRSAVPINVNGETVGILYGVIKLDKLGERYGNMAQELGAQLFVYDKETGKLVVDTIHDTLGNISFLENRKYNEGYSYEQIRTTDKGFVSFMSAFRNESLHLHYSTIEDLNWMIAMGRYDSQVFKKTHETTKVMLLVFFVMLCIIGGYVLVLLFGDSRLNAVTMWASEARRELIETADGQDNIFDALVLVGKAAKSRSSILFDTRGNEYQHAMPEYESKVLSGNERKYFKNELFRYATQLYQENKVAVSVMCIKPNRYLANTNPSFCAFLKEHEINKVCFATVVNNNNSNNITILGAVNPARSKATLMLVEKIAACFSMALYNKNHLDKTEAAATTDALTGTLNRVSYKNDVAMFDEEKDTDFSCIYIDVNELHICNNKYGHAAGDEMLLYIANSLKEVFDGHKVYRIGGDEFIVFAKNTAQDTVKELVDKFLKKIHLRNYHAAIGISYRAKNMDTTELIKEAEVRMYEEKAIYYQNKEKKNSEKQRCKDYVQIKTGILEIDTILSILKENYNGIYRVSLDTDKARRILMPAYLKYSEDEENYSNLFSRYVSESVAPDYHRAMTSFLNYDVIRRQLMEGNVPKIRYKKNSGETVILSVYKLGDDEGTVADTLWVFAKE